MRTQTFFYVTMFTLVLTGLLVAACSTSVSTAATEPVTEGSEPATSEWDWFSVELTDAQTGQTFTMNDYAGKVVVLDLWATWCPPCRLEIPFLIELFEEHKDAGLVVVGIGLDDGGEKVLRPFVEQNGITYPILVGNRDVGQTYKLQGIPTTFILDREGRIAAKHLGFQPSYADVMREQVSRLLGAAGEEA